eukprot:m51a1_g6245 hypothetical protein (168) ;mRNA; f:26774-27724
MAPPCLWASSDRVFLATPFQVTFIAGTAWMEHNGVTEAAIRGLAGHARVYLESSTRRPSEEWEEAPPCPKCCRSGASTIAIGFAPKSKDAEDGDGDGPLDLAQAQAQPGSCTIVFDYCRSRCNSSRLHLGGRVVAVLEVLDADGNLEATLYAQLFKVQFVKYILQWR